MIATAFITGGRTMVREPFLRVRFLLIAMLALVATTKRAIARVEAQHPGPIVLVGHSYGGVVIGEAGNDPNVVALVYVAAFVPDQGQSVLSLLLGFPTPTPIGSHLVSDGSFFTIDPTGVEQDFAQCLPAVERDVLTATQGPTSGAAPTDVAISPAWKVEPSWFIVAKRDRVIPPDLEETEAATIGARTTTLNTCHLAMLDLPSKVAAVIADAAGGQ
jgi:pimeloyl-ACP methyl ester carboxylesterase